MTELTLGLGLWGLGIVVFFFSCVKKDGKLVVIRPENVGAGFVCILLGSMLIIYWLWPPIHGH